jgi:wyosine [tRNA(Phe)-imidazoG37] synthetase (radical SAM superfamily)
MLSTQNHDRDVVGLTYVYPVVSRRAGGVSLGINLSPNNACNWHCVYCQVPNLKLGVSPEADIKRLSQELDAFLQKLMHGNYMQKHVPDDCQVLKDIAISGNGEPTTCPNFLEAVEAIMQIMKTYELCIPLRLITNGSSVHKPNVQQGLKRMAAQRGEVWFKLDAIGEQRTQGVNGVSLKPDWQIKQLQAVAQVCAVKLQTCVLKQQTQDDSYAQDYLAWLKLALAQGIKLEGVLLYGLARPSMQDGGADLASADKIWMQGFAEKIESLGLSFTVS